MDDVITDSVGDVIVQVDKNQYFFEFCFWSRHTFRKPVAMAMKQYFRKHLLPYCAQTNSGKIAMFSTNSPISSNAIFKELTGGPLEHPHPEQG